jgi:hypothetical protein
VYVESAESRLEGTGEKIPGSVAIKEDLRSIRVKHTRVSGYQKSIPRSTDSKIQQKLTRN